MNPLWRQALLNGVVRTTEAPPAAKPAVRPALGWVGRLERHQSLLVAVLGFLLLGFHLGNLTQVPPDWDEASFSYYALHGNVHPWDETAPAGMRSFFQIYSFPQMPLHSALERLVVRMIGFGLWQLRLASSLACLGSLVLLGLMFRKAGHRYLRAALLWFGCSYIFFISSHNARPDGFILLTAVANLLWVYSHGGRVTGFLTGGLAGAMFGVHASASLVVGTTVLLITACGGLRAWRQPRTLWWLIGLGSAVTGVLFLFDADQLAQWWQAGLKAGNLSPPLLVRFQGNLWAMLCNVLYVMGSRLFDINWLHAPLQAVFFAAAILQARRWRLLSRLEQLLLLTAFGMTALYGTATGSVTLNYFLYVNVWFAFPLLWLLWRGARAEITLDWSDAAIFFGVYGMTMSAVFFGRSNSALQAGLLLGTFALVLVLYARVARWVKPLWLRVGMPLLVLAVILSFPSHRQLLPIFFRWMAHYYPDVLMATAVAWLACVAILHPVREGVAWFWPSGPRTSLRQTTVAFLGLLMIGTTLLDSLANARMVQSGRLIPDFRREVSALGGERVLGPAQLYLYDPALTFWSVVALQNAVWSMRLDALKQIERLKITVLFWPQAQESMLSFGKASPWRRGDPVETPFGPFVPFRREKSSR